GVALVALERLETGGIAVVGGDDFARAGNRERNPILGPRYLQALFVGNGDSDEREVLAIGFDGGVVGLGPQPGPRAGRLDNVPGPFLAAFISTDFQSPRLMDHIVPSESVFELAFLAAALDLPLRNSSASSPEV